VFGLSTAKGKREDELEVNLARRHRFLDSRIDLFHTLDVFVNPEPRLSLERSV
jgi:hypothetical protein